MGIENPVHLLFIAVIALVVLGPRRLPELARTLGNGLREFRNAVSSDGVTHSPAGAAPEPAPAPMGAQPGALADEPAARSATANADPAASPEPPGA